MAAFVEKKEWLELIYFERHFPAVNRYLIAILQLNDLVEILLLPTTLITELKSTGNSSASRSHTKTLRYKEGVNLVSLLPQRRPKTTCARETLPKKFFFSTNICWKNEKVILGRKYHFFVAFDRIKNCKNQQINVQLLLRKDMKILT